MQTAAEMQDAVLARSAAQDVIVMAAAVADFRPKEPPTRKLKKHEGIPEIVLEPTHDFLVDLGRDKPAGQVLVGFAAETDDLLDNAADKLRSKRLDLIVGNDISQPDAGLRGRHQPRRHPRCRRRCAGPPVARRRPTSRTSSSIGWRLS